ncbi:MAG TPA: cellulose-binding protein [Coleofasciculaceae cyanobacterium]|jgi:hypothetical protein
MALRFFGLKNRQTLFLRAIVWLTTSALTMYLAIACSSGNIPNGVSSNGASSNGASSNGAIANGATPNESRPELAVGTNLRGITDWSTQVPFLDLFKSARTWIPQCVNGEPGCDGSWDTGEFAQLDLDEQGWVKSLPQPEDAPKYTRVRTILLGGGGKYPQGQYVVLYDGEGTIEYTYDARKDEAASKPGRDIIEVNSANGGEGAHLMITATDPRKTGNYIRNIRVVPIAHEMTYETEIFNPAFIEKTQKFSALRFMDWMNTNSSEQREWSDRPKVEDASYAFGKGVPLEIMIALANRLGADPWFNMPHKATDDYMQKFASLAKEKLDSKLKVYVELSNEVWNWTFPQSHYALEQGKARWGQDKGDAFAQWYGMRAAQMADIWKQVFGEAGAGQSSRLIAVLSTQTGWQGLETSILDCSYWVAEGNTPCYQHGDAYAVTGYFSGNLGSPDAEKQVESWLKESNGGFGQALKRLDQKGDWGDSLQDTRDGFVYHKKVAESKGLKFLAYEAGQHVAGRQGVENNAQLTQFFINLNRRPEMYEMYTKLLNSWKDEGGSLFMHFSDIDEPSKWGSWGALEYVDQPNSPKYDALMDFIQQNQLR